MIRRLNIGFVRYHNRLNAEFAHVAMADQVNDASGAPHA